MKEYTNKDHAKKAERLLIGYSEMNQKNLHPEDIIDILADIRHLCDAKKWDFADLDRLGYRHYCAEIPKPRLRTDPRLKIKEKIIARIKTLCYSGRVLTAKTVLYKFNASRFSEVAQKHHMALLAALDKEV